MDSILRVSANVKARLQELARQGVIRFGTSRRRRWRGRGRRYDPQQEGSPLVYSSISARTIWYEVYPRSLKIVRNEKVEHPRRYHPVKRGSIQGFSLKSKQRLKFTAVNSRSPLISQFGMTYHDAERAPKDGRVLKAQLHAFVTAFDRWIEKHCVGHHGYLWVLEFQTRGVPHFHLYTTLHHETAGLRRFLALTWHRIAEPGSLEHLKFHLDERNFIAWDMGSGAYLCKYLDKERQKLVPPGFENVGRFWGSSRGLVSEPVRVSAAEIDKAHGSIGKLDGVKASQFVLRSLGKAHESMVKRYRKRSWVRTGETDYLLMNGGENFRKAIEYLGKRPSF